MSLSNQCFIFVTRLQIYLHLQISVSNSQTISKCLFHVLFYFIKASCFFFISNLLLFSLATLYLLFPLHHLTSSLLYKPTLPILTPADPPHLPLHTNIYTFSPILTTHPTYLQPHISTQPYPPYPYPHPSYHPPYPTHLYLPLRNPSLLIYRHPTPPSPTTIYTHPPTLTYL